MLRREPRTRHTITTVMLCTLYGQCEQGKRPEESGLGIAVDAQFLLQPSGRPFSKLPELRMRGVLESLLDHYPRELRREGVGGDALVWVLVGNDGNVWNSRLARSSTVPALDSAAIRVAQAWRFRPAEDEGRTIAFWIAVPVRFRPDLNHR